ncbi:MAG TPA: T9SS type A sorting domain-containing protein [Ohtaekwangia sp.]|nr:T9SS type A sorting domain-containing protein [Ohtaekwangia sp.]
MARLILVGLILLTSFLASGQSFEISDLQETYKGNIGEVVKAPIRFKNNTDKIITLVIHKLQEQIGSTQRNFYCIDNNCLDQKTEDYIVRVEPGQFFNGFHIDLEGGLVSGSSLLKYLIYNRSNPQHALEFDLNFVIEEKTKENIYQSRLIELHEVYPNPSVDHAFVNYKILSDRIKAKIRLHNLLGNVVGEYDLTASENAMRIRTEELSAGIYFYTLYVDNESVITRKLIVKK